MKDTDPRPEPPNPFDEDDDDVIAAGASAAMTPESEEHPADSDIYRVPSSNEPIHSHVPDDAQVLYRVSDACLSLVSCDAARLCFVCRQLASGP